MVRPDRTRTAFPLILVVVLSSPVAIASPITPSRFGPEALTESFEGIRPGAKVVRSTQNLLIPDLAVPFRLDSGVSVGRKISNGGVNQGEVSIIDFSGTLDPTLGITSYGLDVHGSISGPADVPLGAAFLTHTGTWVGTTPLEFHFDADMGRVGAFVTGIPGQITLSAFDADGLLLEMRALPAVDQSLWAGHFLGIEREEGIRKVTFTGEHLVLDGLMFESVLTVPEPSTLAIWGAIAAATVARFRPGRTRSGRRVGRD